MILCFVPLYNAASFFRRLYVFFSRRYVKMRFRSFCLQLALETNILAMRKPVETCFSWLKICGFILARFSWGLALGPSHLAMRWTHMNRLGFITRSFVFVGTKKARAWLLQWPIVAHSDNISLFFPPSYFHWQWFYAMQPVSWDECFFSLEKMHHLFCGKTWANGPQRKGVCLLSGSKLRKQIKMTFDWHVCFSVSAFLLSGRRWQRSIVGCKFGPQSEIK